MHAEETLDPAEAATRKVERMSDLVAEMVLGACWDDDESSSAAMADLVALHVARSVSIAPPADVDVDVDVEIDLDLELHVELDEHPLPA